MLKKVKAVGPAVVKALLSPELRPLEVKILRVVGLAAAAALGLHFA